jgi:NAD(P)-dependent dehydrogenase (short-subunit alcohol dehydrogenase family)
MADRPAAVVTGAGRGLGREHALALARAGYAVLVNDLGGEGDGTGADLTPAQQVVAEIQAMGGEAMADGSDVADWNAAGAMIAKAVDAFGRLDALVTNAGALRDRMFVNMTEEDWDIALRVNLKGTAAPLHHAARHWRDVSKETGAPVNAAVVTTTSGSGLYYNVGQANYSSAKAGVAALTVLTSRELIRYGVRVNCIAPVAATRLTASVMPEESRERLDPSFVSPLVVYLLSRAAGDVTGRIFHVGGDAFLLYDTMRPLGGYRSPDGRWTAEAIAEVMPTLLAETTPPLDSREASRFLSEAPLP